MIGTSRRWIPILVIAVIAAGFTLSVTRAQPGSETDPVVSLTYLESALALAPIVLEGGEDFGITGGRGLVLIDGSCRLIPPVDGEWWIVDVTSGEVLTETVEMYAGHLYLPVSDGDPPAEFTIQAWQTSTLAIPGGAGR